MNIFENRPLSMILFIMLGGFAVFGLADPPTRAVLIALAVAGSLGLLLVWWCKRVRKPFFRIAVGMLTLLLSFLFSHLYMAYFCYADADDAPYIVVGVVEKIDYNERYGACLDIRVESVGEDMRFGTHMKVYTDEECAEVQLGDRIQTLATIHPIAERTSDASEMLYYYGKGIALTAEAEGDVDVIGRGRFSPAAITEGARRDLLQHLTEVAGEKAAGLACGLILGDRGAPDPALKLDFSRIGVSHLLALSGMHLTVLAGMLTVLLKRLRVNKKVRLVILDLAVLGYMMLTGFPVSVVRAGWMLILSTLFFLLRQTKDSLTVLSLSVFGIWLISPHAVFDLSLWLSALSVFGILALGVYEDETRASRPKRIAARLLSPLAVSMAAVSFTLLACVYSFDHISALSPFSTAILGLLMPPYMVLALLTRLFGGAIPTLGTGLHILYSIVARIGAVFSDLPFACVGTVPRIVRISATIFTAILIIFMVFPLRRKRLALVVLSVCFFSVFLSAHAAELVARSEEQLIYYAQEKDEHFLLRSDGGAYLIDLSRDRNDYTAQMLSLLTAERVTDLDGYVAAQYNGFTPRALRRILSDIRCRTVYVPEPKTEAESAILADVRAAIEPFRCEIVLYRENESVALGASVYHLMLRPPHEEGAKVIFSIICKQDLYTYMARGTLDLATENAASERIAHSRGLIFGCRGRKYPIGYEFLLQCDAPECIVVSDADVTIGAEALRYYLEKGTKFAYRPLRIVLTR